MTVANVSSVSTRAEPGGLAGRRRRRAQQREQPLRLAVARIEGDGCFEVPHGLVDVAQPPLDLRRQAMTLNVLRTHLENRLELDLRWGELAVGHERLGQDQPSRRVVRIAREPVAAERDRVARPSGLAIEVGELREGEEAGSRASRSSCRRMAPTIV